MRTILIWLLLLSSGMAAENVVLHLKWHHQFQFAGYYAAKEKGFYAEAGLDVEIRERNIERNNITHVVEKEGHYGISDSVLFLYKARGTPLVVVTPIFQHSPSVLLTSAHSGIDTPFKLQDKRLIFYKKDTDGLAILAMLQQLDIQPKIERLKGSLDHTSLLDGTADAYVAYRTNEPYYLKNAHHAYNIINPAHYGFDFYGDMLFTSVAEAQKHPDRVRRFKEATIKGWHYAMEHKEEMIRLISRKYATTKSIEHLRFEADALDDIIMQRSIPIGTLDPGRIQYAIDTYKRLGLISSDIPLDEYVFKAYQSVTVFSTEEQHYLTQKQLLKLCIDPDWMPFEKIDNGRHIGMTADYMRLLEREIGIPIELVPTKTWNESLHMGKSRQCDIFSLVMPTPERQTYLDFTEPFLRVPLVIATRTEELFIPDIASLKGKKIGIVDGYAYGELLRTRHPDLDLIDVPTLHDGLEQVERKTLFGMIGTLPTVGYEIQTHHVNLLKIAGKFDDTWELGIGTRNDEPLLQSIFSKAVYAIPPEMRQNILNKWISVTYEHPTDYPMLFRWLAGIGLIIAILFYAGHRANMRLKREVVNRQRAEHNLQRYVNIVDEHVMSSSTDLEGVITEVSTAFCDVSGYAKEELIGRSHAIIRHPKVPKNHFSTMWQRLSNDKSWRGELKNRSKSGETFWVNVFISPVYDQEHNKVGYTAIMHDITSNKRLEELSITDELTKLYNRRHFNQLLPHILNQAKRDDSIIAMAVIDIDHFKLFNDTYGHIEGDTALTRVSDVMLEMFKRADDYCFRLGGEEFAILMKVDDHSNVETFIEAFRERIVNLNIPHASSKIAPYLTISCGVYLTRADQLHNADELYREADRQLYDAKAQGRNQTVFKKAKES